MSIRIYFIMILACLSLLFSTMGLGHLAYGVVMPRPIGNEKRIKIINYTPNAVIRFVGHYMYHSIIEFGNDEAIETITMGIPTAWQLHPTGNRIFLKPIEDDAETNMTVITNKRMYFFEMYAEYANGIDDGNLVFMMKFLYPEGPQAILHTVGDSFSTPDLAQPSLYNFKYQMSGRHSEIEPILIFDDGEFTYFKFRRMNTELPAFFLVNSQGAESLINYRVYGGYVIVERVAKRFTLRHGEDVICVFNKDYDEHVGQNVNTSEKNVSKKQK
jgi:type IV secretion system protein VirB9